MATDADVQPVLSDAVPQSGVADLAGALAYSGVSDAEAAGEVAFGGSTADFILYGVVNGAFSQGPPDSTQNIEPVNNPLPYWTGPTLVQGGGWTATWVTNAAYPSGHALRLSCTGVLNDEAYVEQVVPIGGSYSRASGNAVRATFVGVDAAPSGKVALQYLDADGNAVGSATSATSVLAPGVTSLGVAYGHAQSDASPPADAAYLRTRVGIVLAGSGLATVDITDVRNDWARLRLMVAEQTTPADYAAGLIYQNNGVLTLAGNGDTATGYIEIGGGYVQVGGALQPTSFKLPVGTGALTTTEGYAGWQSTTERVRIYDGQRERAIGNTGWVPMAYPLNFVANAAFTTTTPQLAVGGGSCAIPIFVPGHMLLQSVLVRNTNGATERTWGWDLYEQRLNNGNAGENTLDRVAASTANETFTPGAASTREIAAATLPTYLAPGLYWLVIQNRHAVQVFNMGCTAASAAFVPNVNQTKTTTNPNGATLDFVAATWVKDTSIIAVALRGRVFGQTAGY